MTSSLMTRTPFADYGTRLPVEPVSKLCAGSMEVARVRLAEERAADDARLAEELGADGDRLDEELDPTPIALDPVPLLPP